ncbi:glycine cleavage system protein T [Gluconacetobacter johannae DSM 13595]|uniref:Folate-binding protein YgfZ n=1 Tax=Gluconacetobacter johannae TaxID=112140 RepID=A0A7W4P5S6_9PROT|nr:folate-binding protein YgfZ [Gluconacetobacter johannae]MBB2176473.1 folate-binding protein YgfZ [Gluconacetobacter johannae]GBQ90069.1 glycine cleavage system protein T [Gluconacetobacter johannae DSM 13595]
MTHLTSLPDRTVLAVSGADRVSFLQGLVSNDVTAVAAGRAVWAAFLTPQGRWLADFFIFADPGGERLLLECEAAQADMLRQRLSRYRLRSDVTIAETGFAVHAAWDAVPSMIDSAIGAPDPRLAEAGWRLLLPHRAPGAADPAAYDAHRLSLGLPDGSRDCESGKTLLLEANFEALNGISWTKGCYMGQELTARTRYRGLVKRKLLPVTSAALPAPGTPILHEGREAGTMASSRDGRGLAMLRLDQIHADLQVEGHPIHVHVPSWLTLPES